MDINLPLLLFIAVTFTGAVWLFDLLALKPKRDKAIAGLDAQYQDKTDEQKLGNEKYRTAFDYMSAEPVVVEYSKSFFPVLLLVFVLRSFIVEPFQIPSESMVPTLEVGDFILVNKFAYGIRLPLIRTKIIDITDPKRGDVMVFFPPHEDRYFIKRVIGLPGDTIRYKDNTLYINGEKMPQDSAEIDGTLDINCGYAAGRNVVVTENLGSHTHKMRKCESRVSQSSDDVWQVPDGHYFMMGDNRDNSLDSRAWGPVPEQRIVGKAFAIWMHWDSLFSIPSFSRVGKI